MSGLGPFFVRKVPMTYTQSAVAGQTKYYLPIESFYQGGETLYLNGVKKTLGSDYTRLGRTLVPASVADMYIGFELVTPPAGGESLRFDWFVNCLSCDPPPVRVVRLVGGVVDYTQPWLATDPLICPNGIGTNCPPILAIEFWRYTSHTGGLRHHNYRAGRRYVAYYRAAPGVDLFDRLTFCSGGGTNNKNWKFCICYYDPVSQARSPFSKEFLCQRYNRPEKANGFDRRAAGSVWLV
jgi:hypothetical protein